jgi:hypothetical protein
MLLQVVTQTDYNFDCILFFAFFISINAKVCLCTSSGPSAIRSVRNPTNARAKGKSPHTPAPPKTCSEKLDESVNVLKNQVLAGNRIAHT